jgi:hypothetical protein
MFVKYVEDSVGRIASLKSAEQWMRGEVFPGFLFIDFQSTIEDDLIVGLWRHW